MNLAMHLAMKRPRLEARGNGISCDVSFFGRRYSRGFAAPNRRKAHGAKVRAEAANSLSPAAS